MIGPRAIARSRTRLAVDPLQFVTTSHHVVEALASQGVWLGVVRESPALSLCLGSRGLTDAATPLALGICCARAFPSLRGCGWDGTRGDGQRRYPSRHGPFARGERVWWSSPLRTIRPDWERVPSPDRPQRTGLGLMTVVRAAAP